MKRMCLSKLGRAIKVIDKISDLAMKLAIIQIISRDNNGREFVPIPVFSITTTVISLWLPLYFVNSLYFGFEFRGVISVFGNIFPVIRRLSEASRNGDALLFCGLWASLPPSIMLSFRISMRAPKIIMAMVESGVDPFNIAVSMIIGMFGFATCMYVIFFAGNVVDILFGSDGGVMRIIGMAFMYSASSLWIDSCLTIYFMLFYLFKRRVRANKE